MGEGQARKQGVELERIGELSQREEPFVHNSSPVINKAHPVKDALYKVEMAGIEPASERLDPRKSTSVAC